MPCFGKVSFLDGPVVLAGLTAEERNLTGDPAHPATLLKTDRERNLSWWNSGYYRTASIDRSFRFIPLYEVKDESYTVYFSIKPN